MSTLSYFIVPKALDTYPQYQNLSTDAKYLYGLLRDRQKLSEKNGWKDDVGTFILFARAKIAEILKKSLPTVRKIIAELVKVGLIIDRRLGLTQCNKIYVQPLIGEGESELPSKEKQDFTPDGKHFAPNNRNSSNTYRNKYIERTNYQKKGANWPKGTVLAQQYQQREYTREELLALYEDV